MLICPLADNRHTVKRVQLSSDIAPPRFVEIDSRRREEAGTGYELFETSERSPLV